MDVRFMFLISSPISPSSGYLLLMAVQQHVEHDWRLVSQWWTTNIFALCIERNTFNATCHQILWLFSAINLYSNLIINILALPLKLSSSPWIVTTVCSLGPNYYCTLVTLFTLTKGRKRASACLRYRVWQWWWDSKWPLMEREIHMKYTTPIRRSRGNPSSLTMLEFLNQFPSAPFDPDR